MSAAAIPASVHGTPRSMQRAAATAGLLVAATLPLLVSPGGVALENMVLAAAYVIMALGLNVVVGFAGLLDLGYVAFYAIGATSPRTSAPRSGASTSTSCSSSCSPSSRRRPPVC